MRGLLVACSIINGLNKDKGHDESAFDMFVRRMYRGVTVEGEDSEDWMVLAGDRKI